MFANGDFLSLTERNTFKLTSYIAQFIDTRYDSFSVKIIVQHHESEGVQIYSKYANDEQSLEITFKAFANANELFSLLIGNCAS